MKKMKFKRFLICAIVVITSIMSYNGYVLGSTNVTELITGNEKVACITNDTMVISPDSLYKMTQIAQKDSIKESLVAEVTKYVNINSPKAADYIPSYIVEACLRENIDICFCMAQTEIETNYGTTGIGRSSQKKSMFGVMKRSYPNYYKAIDDYIVILKKNYLGNGKTEQHLMKNYVTHSGYRYASSRSYETNLSNTYKEIETNTQIKKLQKKYNRIKC